jgi:hypothetical protein
MFNIRRVKQLETEVAQLKADLKRAREENNIKVMADCHGSEFVIDWANMDAFSIERQGGAKVAHTIIGYYNTVNGVRTVDEWKFFCSQEQHNKLAQEFRDGIAKKNNSAVR